MAFLVAEAAELFVLRPHPLSNKRAPPSLRSRAVSPLRGSAEPAARLHSKIERPIKNPNPFGLRFVIGGGGGNCTYDVNH